MCKRIHNYTSTITSYISKVNILHNIIVSNTHLSTAHCTQDGVLVLILSCQTNSIHNTIVLKAIRLMEKNYETIRYMCHVTHGRYEVPGGQSKILGHPYWLSVSTRGGYVQQGALGSKVVASRHLYRGCIESQVTVVIELTFRK